MAAKRMFDISIIDQDKFIDLPATSRLLYYELGMRADDDGFIAPQKVIRMLGLSQDDLKMLIVKSFVLQFEDGVVVITNWKTNNLIRIDRYKPTLYQSHLKLLKINADNSYELGIPNDNQVTAQVRLGKVSIDKDSIVESSIDICATSSTFSLDEFLEDYNAIRLHFIPNGRPIKAIDIKTKRQFAQLLKQGIVREDMQQALRALFLDQHHRDSNWKYCTMEFITRPDKFARFSITEVNQIQERGTVGII